MKKIIILSTFLSSLFSTAQIGINTVNPQGSFHIDGAKDNPNTGTPSAAQQANDFAVTSSGQVGIGVTSPTERLDIATGNVRIRDINTTVGDFSNKIVVADSNGILKIVNASPFSTTNAGNRYMQAFGGTSYVLQTNWQDATYTNLPLNESYDPYNAYDPATGNFTVPADGLYYIFGVFSFNIKSGSDTSVGSGVFNGESGTFRGGIALDGVYFSFADVKILRGTRATSGTNTFSTNSNVTVWLRAGQKVSLIFFSQNANNMAAVASDVTIDRSQCSITINKIL